MSPSLFVAATDVGTFSIVLPAFLKFWPDCPYRIYVGLNSCGHSLAIGAPLLAPASEWYQECRLQLAQVAEDYLVVILDDFLIGGAVDQQRVAELVNVAVTSEVDYLRLLPLGRSLLARLAGWRPPDLRPGIERIRIDHPFYSALQIAIWRKRLLQSMLAKRLSVWEFEHERPPASVHGAIKERPPFVYRHLVEKGRWRPNALRSWGWRVSRRNSANDRPGPNRGTHILCEITSAGYSSDTRPAEPMATALITGINGQDGSYLAELLLDRGYRVVGLVRADVSARVERIDHIRHRIDLIQGSLLDERTFRQIIEQYKPREIYNLAARASSSHLFADPVLTADTNGLAVLKMLELIRMVDPSIRFCQASSSEMFGGVSQSPQNELTPFRPRNPYGVAKLFGHGMVSVYRERFGVFACSAILFNHESPRRSPELVTRKIALGVAQIKAGLTDSLQLGSLEATRDWGYAGDYVLAMWQMLQVPTPDDYVVATGESHSVREFCECAFSHVGLDYRKYVQVDVRAQRAPEAVKLVGDANKARSVLGWRPTVSFQQLVQRMVEADVENLARRG